MINTIQVRHLSNNCQHHLIKYPPYVFALSPTSFVMVFLPVPPHPIDMLQSHWYGHPLKHPWVKSSKLFPMDIPVAYINLKLLWHQYDLACLVATNMRDSYCVQLELLSNINKKYYKEPVIIHTHYCTELQCLLKQTTFFKCIPSKHICNFTLYPFQVWIWGHNYH